MSRTISIQFLRAGKMYDFDAGTLELVKGDHVVVETERGLGIGRVVRPPRDNAPAVSGSLAVIKRKATDDDMATLERISQKEKEAFNFCAKRISERNMQMKLVRVEYQFDSSKAVFFFTADGRIDFRDLVKDLAHNFHTRIEMRQIGVRDESKMIGGIGICGRELCCCSFLRDFQPVSVKMAKEQNLALNPNKISGQCGRLLCCLDYEYETYCCLRKNYPKSGKRVRIANGGGVIDKVNILTGSITLKLDDNKIVTIRREEILGDPASAPHDAPPVRPDAGPPAAVQKERDRRPDQRRVMEHRESAAVSSSAAHSPETPAASVAKTLKHDQQETQTPPKNSQGRKKHRARRHGHRKPQGNTPGGGTPAPAS